MVGEKKVRTRRTHIVCYHFQTAQNIQHLKIMLFRELYVCYNIVTVATLGEEQRDKRLNSSTRSLTGTGNIQWQIHKCFVACICMFGIFHFLKVHTFEDPIHSNHTLQIQSTKN